MTQAQLEDQLKDAQKLLIQHDKQLKDIEEQNKNIDKTLKKLNTALIVSILIIGASLLVIDYLYKSQSRELFNALELLLIEKHIITH